MSQKQDELYREAADTFGAALDRLVRAYELDFDKRRDLLQEIHLALWRSFDKFEERASLRTWVYRVAHNTATSYAIRQRRLNSRLLFSLEQIDHASQELDVGERMDIERLLELIHQLRPPDRELMLLYLEDIDAAAIGEIMGISPGTVRIQIHRIKRILARRFHTGGHT